MPALHTALKRLVVGRPYATERLARERLPVRVALPTFAADALSGVAYAPDEILLTLALAGVASATFSPWVALGVLGVMAIVVLTSRNIAREYPGGGGDYAVAAENLGPAAGRVVGSALMVDYVLTVAVSISQASHYASGMIPALHGREVALALGLIVLLALVNLRGVRDSGRLLAIPVYLFMAVIGALLVAGALQGITGTLGQARSAGFELVPAPGYEDGLTALGGTLLVMRAFSSGCAALTGVEAVANGVPTFRRPAARNAGRTLLLLGGISSVMILGIIVLARATGVQFVRDVSAQLREGGRPVRGYQQLPVIEQIAQVVFSPGSVLFFVVSGVTALVLFLAANTAFHGFPNLASVLARADYLPRRMRVRGDRLAYSNGIIALALAALVLVWATRADVTLLIQMYIVGLFVAFSCSQLGMVRHYTRRLRVQTSRRARRAMAVGRAMNAVGFVTVAAVLVIVVLTKFLHGAWAALLGMAVLWLLMTAVRSHYDQVRAELTSGETGEDDAAPSRSHAVVLVTRLDRPTRRALAVAAAARHSSLEALTVDDADSDTAGLLEQWRHEDMQVPLRIVYSPYRAFTTPVLTYVHTLAKRNPRDVVVVYVPEFLVGHWWEWMLHNHSARRLRTRLAHLPRVVVATVPWQLGSARETAGQVRAAARPAALSGR